MRITPINADTHSNEPSGFHLQAIRSLCLGTYSGDRLEIGGAESDPLAP